MSDTTDPSQECLFCRMVRGEIPADVVHETDATLAFRDINPQAPTHVLVIPKAHHVDAVAMTLADPEVLTAVFSAAARVAEQEGLAGNHRLVFNTGADAGQTVWHAHLHVLGGRSMHWPPG